ncbi:hypothetical protein IC230_33495 [Spirosoma sp. BT704]|uniref:Uncharacterized protein n=2 Tax=Spirosoma validum TaxID=2771355 RepID=A0A927GHD4_9BACT|nr:hypothetical protein [Spirosoma validum]
MRVEDLSPQTLDRIRHNRWDRIIEKHEGPETWELKFKTYQPDDMIFQWDPGFNPIAARPQFMQVSVHWILLPVSRSHHPNITILHHFRSEDHAKLVVYLKDTTYDDSLFGAGYVAIGDRQPEGFYLTTLYHEWFVIDYDAEAKALFSKEESS